METNSKENLLSRIDDLENRLAEAEQLIEAIKAGEVDAFALNRNEKSEIFTLQSGDYAYRVLVENINEGAVNLTEEGLIVYTNSYFHHLLNLPYEKVIGNSVFEFIHQSSKELFRELFTQGLTGESKGEINFTSGQKKISVYVSLTSLHPTLPTVGMIVTDLTQQKRSEKKLEAAYKKLEEKNIELAKSNTELASFSYIASHDLQEPLRKIQTFADRLLEKEASNLSERGSMMFGRMQLAAKRMQMLIDDLIEYSRISNAELKFENTPLDKIIEEVKEDLKEELKQKHATIEANGLCHADIIPFQFRQLLYNLIHNAIKFSTPERSPVIIITGRIEPGMKLKSEQLSPEKKYCHISVSDNGIGFEQKYNKKIFELFQRLHGREQYSGTGIGLAIVKRIVEKHNGIIEAFGEPGKGARFDVYIPVRSAEKN